MDTKTLFRVLLGERRGGRGEHQKGTKLLFRAPLGQNPMEVPRLTIDTFGIGFDRKDLV